MDPNPLIDEILEEFRQSLGNSYSAYRNHAQRVFHISVRLGGQKFEQQIAIAAAFHDLGLWTSDTWDYLDPSIRLAEIYCQENHMSDSFFEIKEIIAFHHKMTPYRGNFPSAEFFRKADLVDVSLHRIRFGIPKTELRELVGSFPLAGFHKTLWKLFLRNLRKRPLRPLPMVKR